jgi:hypothetical protein
MAIDGAASECYLGEPVFNERDTVDERMYWHAAREPKNWFAIDVGEAFVSPYSHLSSFEITRSEFNSSTGG